MATLFEAMTPPPHAPRSSILSLYNILDELDEDSLNYLIKEMNHTIAQNMAVGQAVTAIESEDPIISLAEARSNMLPPRVRRNTLNMKSSRLRLSLQTLLRTQSRRFSSQPTTATSATSSSRSSPSYKRISRPFINLPPELTLADLQALLYADIYDTTASPMSGRDASPFSSRLIRRHPSSMDMALEAERCAVGPESMGLDLLEPRPTTPSLAPVLALTQNNSAVVLDGIFETMQVR